MKNAKFMIINLTNECHLSHVILEKFLNLTPLVHLIMFAPIVVLPIVKPKMCCCVYN